ncbi:hypothetical protein NLJ89_g9006 [Agrocybe chaxingu]|uniref:Uncharacterized protein n=1 Tax=Agrocybe chaxingu TaxID=84603 RepID=A0A9W8JRL1_9AGAR|nr:hypothetical protein NLJ89_g9006 [Agrocybe chaxingu]
MLKKLKKTWKEEEQMSQPPAPSPEGPISQTHDLRESSLDIASKSGAKRTRDNFEQEATDPHAERPTKVLKAAASDSLRNHLPEIVDSRDKEEELHISLANLKERIFEQAKQQNSKRFLFSIVLS